MEALILNWLNNLKFEFVFSLIMLLLLCTFVGYFYLSNKYFNFAVDNWEELGADEKVF